MFGVEMAAESTGRHQPSRVRASWDRLRLVISSSGAATISPPLPNTGAATACGAVLVEFSPRKGQAGAPSYGHKVGAEPDDVGTV